MIHEILPVGMLRCNCSILGDEATREAIVVDPGDEIDSILGVLARHGLRARHIADKAPFPITATFGDLLIALIASSKKTA